MTITIWHHRALNAVFAGLFLYTGDRLMVLVLAVMQLVHEGVQLYTARLERKHRALLEQYAVKREQYYENLAFQVARKNIPPEKRN